jgi:hypothetical protein
MLDTCKYALALSALLVIGCSGIPTQKQEVSACYEEAVQAALEAGDEEARAVFEERAGQCKGQLIATR